LIRILLSNRDDYRFINRRTTRKSIPLNHIEEKPEGLAKSRIEPLESEVFEK